MSISRFWWGDPGFGLNVPDADKADLATRDPEVTFNDIENVAGFKDDAMNYVQDLIGQMVETANAQADQLNQFLDDWGDSSHYGVGQIGTEIDLTAGPVINWNPHTVGGLPALDLDVFRPTFNADSPDSFEYEESPYASALCDALVTKLISDIQAGSSGIDPDVEQALYDRAVNKLEAEMDKQQQITEDYFAAKGFFLPTGTLSGRLLELQNGNIKARTDLLNDIIVQRSNLVQQNIQALISGANNLEGLLRQTFDSIQNRALEKSKAIASLSVERYNAEINKYVADIQRYQQDISRSLSIVQQALGIEDLKVRASGIHADAEAKRVDAWAKGESVKIDKARVISSEKVAEKQVYLTSQVERSRLNAERMKSQATILAQVAASALSTFNLNMSYGSSASLSGNVSMSSGWNASEQISMSQSLSNSKSVAKNTGVSFSSSTGLSLSENESWNYSDGVSENWMYYP